MVSFYVVALREKALFEVALFHNLSIVLYLALNGIVTSHQPHLIK